MKQGKNVTKIFTLLLCLILLFSSTGQVYAENHKDKGEKKSYKQFLVKYKDGIQDLDSKMNTKKSKNKMKDFKKLKNKNTYVVSIDENQVNDLKNDSEIELVEEDFMITTLEGEGNLSETTQPEEDDNASDEDINEHIHEESLDSDNYHTEEHLDNAAEEEVLSTGTESLYSNMGDEITWNINRIGASELFQQGISGNGVNVAVFDTGIDLDSDELNVVGGVSFVDGITSYDDDNGHGTEMATIISASNNGRGFVGVAPDINLYSVKILDSTGQGRYSNIINGIDWAIENRINIIVLSLGGNGYSKILEEAVKKASQNNILLIAAAGNSGNRTNVYPAAFHDVVCVSSTDSNNMISVYSCIGNNINIAAPGENIQTVDTSGNITIVSGTSVATQHVAGVAALLWSCDRNLTNAQIKFLLYEGAIETGNHEQYGHGILNAKNSYKRLQEDNYEYTIFYEDGTKETIKADIDVGGEGVVSALTSCPCTTCYQGSSYYNYSEHSSGGHRRVYYCGSSACRTKCGTACNYATSTYDKLSGCSICYPPHVHTWSAWATTPGTCTQVEISTRKCSGCGQTETKSGTINTSNHAWGAWSESKAGTCKVKATLKRTCSRCSTSETTDGEYSSHTWSSWAQSKAGTCKTKAVLSRKCSVCSSIETKDGDYGNHPWGAWQTYQVGTCTKKSTFVRTCSLCQTSEYQYETTNPSNHNLSSSYSCVHRGSYDDHVYTCIDCGTSVIKDSHSCTCHICYYSTKTYRSHTSTGHDVYLRCSCGSESYQGYKEANPNCQSCTTPPYVSISNINSSLVLSETQTDFKVIINIMDNNGEALTCEYFLDNASVAQGSEKVTDTKSTKQVQFTTGINATNLAEGQHTITVKVKNSISPVAVQSAVFYIDKSSPVISNVTAISSTNGITLTVAANDTISGLHSSAYRYTLGAQVSDWITTSEIMYSSLLPNQSYSYSIEVKDKLNHINKYNGTITTLTQVPSITLNTSTSNAINIQVRDENPIDTLYCIRVGEYYANVSGGLQSSISYFTLPTKQIMISGLMPDTTYQVSVQSKNKSGVTSNFSSVVAIATLPESLPAPNNIKASADSQTQITLTWDVSMRATSYEVEVNGSTNYVTITDNRYTHKNLTKENTYSYRIRANIGEVKGIWSKVVMQSTLPNPPGLVDYDTIYNYYDSKGQLYFAWDSMEQVEGYQVEWNGTILDMVTTNSILCPSQELNEQSIVRIRAKNRGGYGDWTKPYVTFSRVRVPSGLEITFCEVDFVTVCWNLGANPNNTRHQIGIFDTQGKLIKMVSTEYETNGTVSGLSADTNYIVKVRALNNIEESTEWTEGIAFKTDQARPKVPSQLKATTQGQSIILYWDSVENATNYHITRDGKMIASGLKTCNYEDRNLLPEQNYTYRVYAANDEGFGVYSNTLVKKTLGFVPLIPNGICYDIKETSITISWNNLENITGYEIEIDGQIINVGAELNYHHNGVEPGSFHTYRLRARNMNGRSMWSDIQTIKSTPLLPTVPQNVVAVASGAAIEVHWNAVKDAKSYEIERNGEIVPVNQLTYQELAPSNGESYVYRVRAVNETGVSDWSRSETVLYENSKAIDLDIQVEVSKTQIILTINNKVSISRVEIIDLETREVREITHDDSITFSNLSSGHRYHYQLRAYGENNDLIGSQAISVTTLTEAPNLKNQSNGLYHLLEWSFINGATEYELQCNGQIIYRGTELRYLAEEFQGDEERVYQVRSINTSGYSDWSNQCVIKEERRQTIHANDIRIVRISNSQVVVSWEPIIEAKGYRILDEYDKEYNVESPEVILDISLHTQLSLKIACLYENNQIGEYSEIVTISVPGMIPKVPVIKQTELTTNSIIISWDLQDDATGYEISIGNDIVNISNESQARDRYQLIASYSAKPYDVFNSSPKIRFDGNGKAELTWDLNLLRSDLNSQYGGFGLQIFNFSIGDTGKDTLNFIVQKAEVQTKDLKKIEISELLGEYSLSMQDGVIRLNPNIDYKRFSTTGDLSGGTLSVTVQIIKYLTPENTKSEGLYYETLWNNEAITEAFVDKLKSQYTYTGILPNTEYVIKVRAVNESGASAWSEPVKITTSNDLTLSPLGFYCNIDDRGEMNLHWNSIEEAIGYEVKVNNETILTTDKNYLPFADALKGRKYTFSVRACYENGTSNWSPAIEYTVNIGAPQNIAIEKMEEGYQVSFSPINGITSYEIEVDGIILSSTEARIILPLSDYLCHKIRVRGKYDRMEGTWSNYIDYLTNTTTTLQASQDEQFSLAMFSENIINHSQYRMELSYSIEDLELVDLSEYTEEQETYTSFISQSINGTEGLKLQAVVKREGNRETVIIVADIPMFYDYFYSGIINCIRFKALNTKLVDIECKITYINPGE